MVGVFTGLAMLGSTAKELVVASWFGRSDALDAFLIAYLIPSFVINLLAGSLNPALIPTFIQVRETEGREAAARLFSGALLGILVLLVLVSAALGLLAPFCLPLVGSGFDSAKLALTVRLLYVLLPVIVLSGLAATWTAVLNAGERFALPALLPILPPLAVIVFLVLAGGRLGVFALAVGTVCGLVFQATALAWTANSHGIPLKPRWHGCTDSLRQMAGQYAPVVAGALLMGSTDLVDQSMAAMLEPGSVAALNYGKKVVTLIVGISSVALSTAALPYFSQMTARQDWEGCRHTLKTYGRVIALASVPITLGLVFFSEPLVRVLFERGAFTAQDTKVVTGVQALLSLEIPFYLLGIMGVRVISALKRNSWLMAISGVNLVVNIVLNWVFMRYAGVAGIALSTSVVYLVSCVLIYSSIASALRARSEQPSTDGTSAL